ncbi:MAG TPA: hypothetical protein VMD07_06710, partial [Candidatus Acidoferrales bacterium]|nr:hypothetical protein [Candidatus Acidoferrales bacterium]
AQLVERTICNRVTSVRFRASAPNPFWSLAPKAHDEVAMENDDILDEDLDDDDFDDEEELEDDDLDDDSEM